jgi:hypothetical protein
MLERGRSNAATLPTTAGSCDMLAPGQISSYRHPASIFRQIADSLESANPQALELLSDRAHRPLK